MNISKKVILAVAALSLTGIGVAGAAVASTNHLDSTTTKKVIKIDSVYSPSTSRPTRISY